MHPDNDPRYIAADHAIREAERFIQRARAWMVRYEKDSQSSWPRLNTREGGAMDRASLDLSEALVKLRKRGQ
ncbi:MAG: hypothetical protein HUU41_13570 [Bryobacteraceae bacterium]|nr:hypothetical protein [Bryobacteraceae bacterium]